MGTAISREALLDRALKVVKDIEAELTKPDEDWEPIAQVSHEDGVVIVPLDLDKEKWGYVLKMLCEQIDATALVIVNTVYQYYIDRDDPEREEKIQRCREVGVKNMEGASEAVLVMAVDPTGIITKEAELIRHKDRPPELGEFRSVEAQEINIFKEVIEYFEEKEGYA